jgi:membrane-associated phospholipid phosphatase
MSSDFGLCTSRIRSTFILALVTLLCTALCSAKSNNSFRAIGNIGQIAVPLSALLVSLMKEGDTSGTKQLAKTYASTMAATYALKYTMNANRPNGGKHSFPSGHAASAFAAATFVDIRYGHKYGIPFYLAALTVGASRVDAKVHSIADVLGSFILSFAFGTIFTSKYKTPIQVSATAMKNGGELRLSLPM